MSNTEIEIAVSGRVSDTINEHDLLRKVRHVVLGLSGGPDSMCLFDVLRGVCEPLGIAIHPVHVNHGIRKGICDEEQKFCEEYCNSIGIPLRSFAYDCEALANEWGVSTEEAGRKIRYDSFDVVVKEINGNNVVDDDTVVAIAQNANDQVETVLMRILRSTGVSGLSGIPYEREDKRGYRIIRPLLDVKRNEILAYCESRNLKPRMDLTNDEPIYRRNKIRLELIPYLEENYNPNISEAILRLAASARIEKEHIDREAEELINTIKVYDPGEEFDYRREIYVMNDDIRNLSSSLRKHAISLFLERVGLSEDVGYEHFRAIERIIMGDNPSANVDLPRNFYVRREYDKLIYGRPVQEKMSVTPNMKLETEEIGELKIRKLNIEDLDKYLTEKKLEAGDYAAFDEDKLVAAYGLGGSKLIEVRKRLPGDVMRLNVGTKKLQDIMVDSKIPVRERDSATVVAIGNEVLWLLPKGNQNRRWSSEFRIDHMSELVVVFYLPENE